MTSQQSGVRRSIAKWRFCKHPFNFSGYLFFLIFLSFKGIAIPAAYDGGSLADLSLEELANLDITSAAKREVPLSRTSASLYVITAEDIRRSGAATIPEALRLAPNLLVARIDAGNYAISARGFNDTFSNKLQVLVDGRSIYTPLYSGVFWDAQDIRLEDIERIEVISGASAVLWGANAVNGVINIITRHSAQTQGGQLNGSLGGRQSHLSARYGGRFGPESTYRLYVKTTDVDDSNGLNGANREDDWQHQQLGFRLDWHTEKENYQLQGDIYRSGVDWPTPRDLQLSGANLLMKWQKEYDSGSLLEVKAYQDYSRRDYPDGFFEKRHTSSIELVHTLSPYDLHRFQWGVNYRYSQDETQSSDAVAFFPAREYLNWVSLFVQDDIQLQHDVSLTLSARAEHNDYSGLEWMPSVRLAWQIQSNQLLWGSASRAIRSPSRFDRDLFLPGIPPYFLQGGPEFRSEKADAYEVGYRALVGKTFFLSATLFRTEYNDLRTLELSSPTVIEVGNSLKGTTTGLEAWANYQMADNWRLSAGWTAARYDFELEETDSLLNVGWLQGNSPSHQWQLRSQWSWSDSEWDLLVRRVGALPDPEVPSYFVIDMRWGWRPVSQLELSVSIHNLLNNTHAEFGPPQDRSEFGRVARVGLMWSF